MFQKNVSICLAKEDKPLDLPFFILPYILYQILWIC